MIHSPKQQEGDHGALAAAQVQAIVPIRAQAFAHAMRTHLFKAEVQSAAHVLIYSRFAAIGKGNAGGQKRHITGFAHVFRNGGNQP